MKFKSLIVFLIGYCVVLTTANADSQENLFSTTTADKSAARATMRAKFLNSLGDKYNFEIINNTDTNFADVNIQTYVGTTDLYSPKLGTFSCAKHTTCQLKGVKMQKMNEYWLFKFYGDDKNLASAYILTNPHPGWNTIIPKDSYLGHYVSSQVKSRYKKYKTIKDVGIKLDKVNGKVPNYQNSYKAILGALASDIKSSHVINCSVSEDKYFKRFKPNHDVTSSVSH